MKKTVESLIAIFLIIAVSAIIARTMAGSETLTEYAEKNPEVAYATKDPTPSPSDPAYLPDTENDEEALPTEPPVSDTNTDNNEGMVTNMNLSFTAKPLDSELIDRITGISYPADSSADLLISYDDLQYLNVLYYDFDGNVQEGELICNKLIAGDLIDIFKELYLNQYQIESIRLVDEFNGDDEASMAANNSSCFNYREIAGTTTLSKHALGLAIDINPLYNPYVTYAKDGSGKVNIAPAGSENYVDREKEFPYKIDENDLCYKLFKEHGFSWGGDWNSSKDYQHFQKSE